MAPFDGSALIALLAQYPFDIPLDPALYNRRVRSAAVFAVFLSLAACNRGQRNAEAVRQGVMDHLASSSLGLNMSGMDVNLTELHINGSQADVIAAISPKGSPAGSGMSIKYHLEQRNDKWVVTGRQDTGGGAPHGTMSPGTMSPGTVAGQNPHGGAMPGAMPGGGSGKMPSPDELPPIKKK